MLVVPVGKREVAPECEAFLNFAARAFTLAPSRYAELFPNSFWSSPKLFDSRFREQ
jgi:hypothetical protein